MTHYSKRDEARARDLCHLRGVDPDKLIGHGPPPTPDGFVYSVLIHTPMWQLVAGEIDAARQMYRVMRDMDAEDAP